MVKLKKPSRFYQEGLNIICVVNFYGLVNFNLSVSPLLVFTVT
jgi:hypothetical protein